MSDYEWNDALERAAVEAESFSEEDEGVLPNDFHDLKEKLAIRIRGLKRGDGEASVLDEIRAEVRSHMSVCPICTGGPGVAEHCTNHVDFARILGVSVQ